MSKIIRIDSCGICPFRGQRRFLQNEQHVCKDVCTNPNATPIHNGEWIIIVNKNLIHPECPLEDGE